MSSPSESSFVKEFQNLHVLSHACDLERMDELVQDLTNALEETMCANDDEGSVSFACKKKQRSRQRSRRRPRSVIKLPGNISEASESSIDEAIKDLIENKGRQSDSDDLLMATKRMTSFCAPSHVLSLAESDSVTENFSPNKPNRRRKRGKRMAVDADTDSKSDGQQTGDLSNPCTKAPALQAIKDNFIDSNFIRDCGGMLPGKRKRVEKIIFDSCSAACPDNYDAAGTSHMDNGQSQTSSCPSSSESEHGIYTNDEGRDADDEHSDFFHEPGPACGVVGIVPWWEQDHDENGHYRDSHFEQILNGSFPYLSKSSKRTFRSRVSRLLAKNREIRASKRRLKDRRGQHHHLNWLGKEPYSRAELGKKHGLAWPSSLDHSVAKYRGTSPPSGLNCCDDTGVVGEDADPIPTNNIGNQMLQRMGWIPGTGLGSDSMGTTMPVVAFKRPKRRGLGATSDS